MQSCMPCMYQFRSHKGHVYARSHEFNDESSAEISMLLDVSGRSAVLLARTPPYETHSSRKETSFAGSSGTLHHGSSAQLRSNCSFHQRDCGHNYKISRNTTLRNLARWTF
jgi:hypothetical protein